MIVFITNGEMILYGIDNINEKLDKIIESLNLQKQDFELKLIMSEAITNAFIHGNNSNRSKPIVVKWELNEKFVNITVKDMGKKIGNLVINKDVEEDILSESGRGLNIISLYADEVKFSDSSIIIKKYY
ncbi:MAG: ATP-binding protein [Clostridium butyricum]|nr:ATP-binding protein [Clostridium butyricum]